MSVPSCFHSWYFAGTFVDVAFRQKLHIKEVGSSRTKYYYRVTKQIQVNSVLRHTNPSYISTLCALTKGYLAELMPSLWKAPSSPLFSLQSLLLKKMPGKLRFVSRTVMFDCASIQEHLDITTT